MSIFTGVKVFCATQVAQRQAIGEEATRWIAEAARTRRSFAIHDIVITQSSDRAFHCISVSIFFTEAAKPARRTP